MPQAGIPAANQTAAPASRLVWLLAAALLLALALAKFVYQDTLRLAYPLNDLAAPWVASQAFLHGEAPYGDTPQLDRIWAATVMPASADCPAYGPYLARLLMASPPTALALLSPLGLLPWHVAVWTYTIGSSILFIFAVLLLAQNLQLSWRDPRKLFFIAFVLAMAPLHSGSQEANLNTLTVACLCVGVALMSKRPYWSGIAIAIAMCLKPQVAIWFFAYMWLRKKWNIAFTTLAAGAALSAGCVLWMWIHHVAWLKPLLDQMAQTASPVGFNGFYPPGTTRFQMVNLQVLVIQFVQSLKWSGILSWAIFAVLAGASAFLIRSRVSDRNESTGIAIVAALTLLPVYQRFHSAETLLFVVYWAVENWNLKGAKTALLLMPPLLFPFTMWLATYAGVPLQAPSRDASIAMRIAVMAERFIADHNLSQNILWNGFVMTHVIWIELILLLILLASLYRQSPTPAERLASGA